MVIEDKEEQVTDASEIVASRVAEILNKNNNRMIDYSLVYQMVKEQVKDKSLIDDVYRSTITLLEDKYGILFDVDKNVPNL